MGGGGGVCTVIFMSNPTVVLCCVGVGVLTTSFDPNIFVLDLIFFNENNDNDSKQNNNFNGFDTIEINLVP